MDLRYQWAKREDTPLIQEFIREQFGADSIQAASGRFDALFTEHPGGFHVALCCFARRIVGVRCYLPARIVCCQQEYQAAFPIDLMVSPEFRRKGISSLFVDMALERFKATVSSGQSTAQAAVYGKKKALIVAAYHKGYLVRRPSTSKGLKTTARDILSWVRWTVMNKPQIVNTDLNINDLNRIQNILSDRFGENDAGIATSGELLAWRYAGSFYQDCRLALLKIGEDSGVVAYRAKRDETQILDILCREKALDNLIRAAAVGLPGNRITAIFAGERLAGRFAAAGFFVRPQEARLTVYTKDMVLRERLQLADWKVFAGDSDTALREFPTEEEPCAIF
ncbi:GNAT family N-acetyltransferase [Desulfofustis glycolicus]|uniref:Acetyltransferase (GNAT) domain-containing protein n=1 Tax=Desulfofustis glycolicus DSM 9705 TaxID=1121409 RepID=A0A1M5YT61_9BACT|nr:GNAT family N-acetyltransferase [Desulfofustis glycolicus]SHI14733.1 Acetyltransferase (GNAT) domain-containing protein [Desulfofustis glycolicus DSM 9705]